MEDTKTKLVFCCAKLVTPLAQSLVQPGFYETARTGSTCPVGIATVPLASW